MRSLLRALPVLVLFVAAIEAVVVRQDLAYRPTDARLYVETVLLWGCFALLAVVPAWLTCRLLTRGRGEQERGPWPPAVLLGWMCLPVVVHPVLDRYAHTGSLETLRAARPWLEVLGAVLALVLVMALLSRLTRRRSQPVFGLLVALVSLGVGLFLPLRRVHVASTADPGTEGRPNLLLLVWDTCRSDRLGHYGHDRPTSPFLDQLADESLVFENSTSVSIFTFSSHMTMLTGMYPSSHGARMLSMRYDPTKASMLAETLRTNGYRTGGFVGTDVLAGRTGVRYGFEAYEDLVDPPVCDTRAWKMIHDVQVVLARQFASFRNNGRPHWIQDFQRPAEDVLEKALAWIDNGDPRPWFCFINLYDVHWPYLPDDAARQELVDTPPGALGGYLFRADDWQSGTTIRAADRDHVHQLYEAEIRELDKTVASFLDALELDAGGTAVLVTADHGEAFGERGQWKHEDIGEVQVRVPFLLRLPEPRPEPERRTEQVSGVDVAPTLLALAGIEAERELEGVDVVGGDLETRVVWVEDRDHKYPEDVRVALYRHPYKLVRNGIGDDSTFHLYDVEADPLGETDIQDREPELFRELRELLEERRADFDAEEAGLRPASGGSQLDALTALGYAGDSGDEPSVEQEDPGPESPAEEP